MLASISLIIVFLYYKINDNLSRLTKYAIITFLFLFLLTFVIYNINIIYDRFLSPDELSNSIKIGHFYHTYPFLKTHYLYLFLDMEQDLACFL